MARRSPARWLAPLALVAVVFALVSIVGGSGDDEEPASSPTAPATTTTGGDGGGKKESGDGGGGRDRKHYVVQPGDTPSQIADQAGVRLEQIEELNPDLDPQLLTPGEKIRIRP